MPTVPPTVKKDKPPKEGYRRLGKEWLSPAEYRKYEAWLKVSDDKIASYRLIEEQMIGR